MRILLDQFLSQTECNCQVVNLGAGFDSLFWLLKVRKFRYFVGINWPFGGEGFVRQVVNSHCCITYTGNEIVEGGCNDNIFHSVVHGKVVASQVL